MRVTQLGGDVEAEVGRVLDGGVSQADAQRPGLLEGLLQQQRLQDGVQILADVLQQHWNTKPASSLQTIIIIIIRVSAATTVKLHRFKWFQSKRIVFLHNMSALSLNWFPK